LQKPQGWGTRQEESKDKKPYGFPDFFLKEPDFYTPL